MIDDPKAAAAVRDVLQQFQDGYTRRDPQAVDAFMQLFVPEDELEVIGTGSVKPGVDEWCMGLGMARELVEGDWQGWGDVRLDLDGAHIHTLGDAAWLAAPGTVSMVIGEENYQDYLSYVQTIINDKDWPAQEKLLYIQRGAANTLYQLHLGEQFVWPFRFTAVLVRREGRWLFHQMQFSFPTTQFPDERVIEKA